MMPTYTFRCDEDNGGCGKDVEITCTFADKEDNVPKECKYCKNKSFYEEFSTNVTVSVPHTLGSFAEKNRKSADEIRHIKESTNVKSYKKWKSTSTGMELE